MSWELNCLQAYDKHKLKRGSFNASWIMHRSSGNQKRKIISLLLHGEKRTKHLNREAYSLFLRKHWKCNHLGQLKLNWTQPPENAEGRTTSTVFWSCEGNQISGVGFFCCCWLKDIQFHSWTATYYYLSLSTQASVWDSPCCTWMWHTCPYSTVLCKRLQAEPPFLTLWG